MLRPEEEEIRPMPIEARQVYVYGIVRAEQDGNKPTVPSLKGPVGDPIRIIAGAGLAALVSTAGASFEDDLKDPEQAKSLVLNHHRVLQDVLGNRAVLPMRFGTLFAGDEAVRDAMRLHRQGLLDALERVEGAREWGVKVYCDRSILRDHLGGEAPAIRAAQSELSAATRGRAFFLQRRIARLGEEEVERAIAHIVEASRQCLCDVARANAAMKCQPAAVHGRAGDMVWNGAYLVSERDEERFFALIGEWRKAHEPCGFHAEINGPWAPFSFADCRLGE